MFISICIFSIITCMIFSLFFLTKRISKYVLFIKSLRERNSTILEIIRKEFLYHYYKNPNVSFSRISNPEINKLDDCKEIIISAFAFNPFIYIFIYLFRKDYRVYILIYFHLANIIFSLVIIYLASGFLVDINIHEAIKIILIGFLSFFISFGFLLISGSKLSTDISDILKAYSKNKDTVENSSFAVQIGNENSVQNEHLNKDKDSSFLSNPSNQKNNRHLIKNSKIENTLSYKNPYLVKSANIFNFNNNFVINIIYLFLVLLFGALFSLLLIGIDYLKFNTNILCVRIFAITAGFDFIILRLLGSFFVFIYLKMKKIEFFTYFVYFSFIEDYIVESNEFENKISEDTLNMIHLNLINENENGNENNKNINTNINNSLAPNVVVENNSSHCVLVNERNSAISNIVKLNLNETKDVKIDEPKIDNNELTLKGINNFENSSSKQYQFKQTKQSFDQFKIVKTNVNQYQYQNKNKNIKMLGKNYVNQLISFNNRETIDFCNISEDNNEQLYEKNQKMEEKSIFSINSKAQESEFTYHQNEPSSLANNQENELKSDNHKSNDSEYFKAKNSAIIIEQSSFENVDYNISQFKEKSTIKEYTFIKRKSAMLPQCGTLSSLNYMNKNNFLNNNYQNQERNSQQFDISNNQSPNKSTRNNSYFRSKGEIIVNSKRNSSIEFKINHQINFEELLKSNSESTSCEVFKPKHFNNIETKKSSFPTIFEYSGKECLNTQDNKLDSIKIEYKKQIELLKNLIQISLNKNLMELKNNLNNYLSILYKTEKPFEQNKLSDIYCIEKILKESYSSDMNAGSKYCGEKTQRYHLKYDSSDYFNEKLGNCFRTISENKESALYEIPFNNLIYHDKKGELESNKLNPTKYSDQYCKKTTCEFENNVPSIKSLLEKLRINHNNRRKNSLRII